MNFSSPTNVVAYVLVIIGALNWGLVGAFGYNLVSAIFGEETALERLIYAVVGLAGLYVAYLVATNIGRRHETV